MEREMLKCLEEGLPVNREPFRRIAERFSLSEEEVMGIISNLKKEKIIRQISPIYDTRTLGYSSSLIAFRIPSDEMDDAAMIINSHPGVSHNYQRNHDFNLWFTIAVPPDSRLGLRKTVELLSEMTGAEDYLILNSRRTFKIGVKLTVDNGMEGKEAVGEFKCAYTPLSEGEKGVIKVTQKDLPIVPRPFAYFADILGMEEDSVILKLREFLEKGVARRFAAVLYHRRAGFLANGMVVWKVPPEDVEKTGCQIASYRAVSHCYERATNGKWQYNIFSVIHGKSRDDVENVVGVISKETGLKDFRVIYSTREFKKARPEYFTDDYYLWEENFI